LKLHCEELSALRRLFPGNKKAWREAVGAGAKNFARANGSPHTHCPHFKLARFRRRFAMARRFHTASSSLLFA
jgi:hypothetical protein